MDWIRPKFTRSQVEIKRKVKHKSILKRSLKVETHSTRSAAEVEPGSSSSEEAELQDVISPILGTPVVGNPPKNICSIKRNIFNSSKLPSQSSPYSFGKLESEDIGSPTEKFKLKCDQSPSPQKNVRTITFSPLNSERKMHRVKHFKAVRKALKTCSASGSKSNTLIDFEDDDDDHSDRALQQKHSFSSDCLNKSMLIDDFPGEGSCEDSILDKSLEKVNSLPQLYRAQSPDLIAWYLDEKLYWQPKLVEHTDEAEDIDPCKESDFEEHPLQAYYSAQTLKMGVPRIIDVLDGSPNDEPIDNFSPESLNNFQIPSSNLSRPLFLSHDSSDDDELFKNWRKRPKQNTLTNKLGVLENRIRNDLKFFTYELNAGLLVAYDNQSSCVIHVERVWKENNCFKMVCHVCDPLHLYKKKEKQFGVLETLILSVEALTNNFSVGSYIIIYYPVIVIADINKRIATVCARAVKTVKEWHEGCRHFDKVEAVEVLGGRKNNEKAYLIRKLLNNTPQNLLDAFAGSLLIKNFALKFRLIGVGLHGTINFELNVVAIDDENTYCVITLPYEKDWKECELLKQTLVPAAGELFLFQLAALTKIKPIESESRRIRDLIALDQKKNKVDASYPYIFGLEPAEDKWSLEHLENTFTQASDAQ